MTESNERHILAELVALKDLKAEFLRLKQRRVVAISREPNAVAEYERLKADYDSREPLAWDAARTALAAPHDPPIQKTDDHLKFVERWAVHHAAKPHMTAEEALSAISHYPPIRAITESYRDGKRPETFDPYAEIERLRAEILALRSEASAQPKHADIYAALRATGLSLIKTEHGLKVTKVLDGVASAQPAEATPVQPPAEGVTGDWCAAFPKAAANIMNALAQKIDALEAAQPVEAPPVQPEPFGYWHQGATEEESDFFKHRESGDVGCENCIKLYTHPAPAQAAESSPAIHDILAERARQDAKWGKPMHAAGHDAMDWRDFIKYQTNTMQTDQTAESARGVFIKIAALAIAAIESIDRRAAASKGEKV